MAIVINGSGTVTGISVGGLPDGIVDAGTLATNSVDSAELIDGSIDNSHIDAMAASKLTGALPAISGASLTNIPAPSGTILQTLTSTTSTGRIIQDTTWLDSYLTVTMTPTASDTKILIFVNNNAMEKDSGSASTSIGYRLLKDATVLCTQLEHGTTGVNAMSVFSGPHFVWIETSGDTTERTYKTQANSTNSYGNTYINFGGTSTLHVLEIGQ